MSTSLDPRGPGRRRGWWLAPELAALVILAVLVVPSLSPSAAREELRGEVAAAAARIVERSSPTEHHDHGHTVGVEDQVVCGIDVFGTEPADPASLDEVRVVYGYFFCAVGPAGMPYDLSGRMDGPVVVTIAGPGPAVTIARSGAGYADRVRAMMPDQYEQFCFGGLPDDSVAARVRARFLAEVSGEPARAEGAPGEGALVEPAGGEG